jgi:hypothetical protein
MPYATTPDLSGNGSGVVTYNEYKLFIPPIAAGANKVYFDLFNDANSNVKLLIESVTAQKHGDVAVTGTLALALYLTRTSAIGTGGTAATLEGTALNAATFSKFDNNMSGLSPFISARNSPSGGATAGAVLSTVNIFPEETAAINYDPVEFLDYSRKIVVPKGTGIRVVQGGVASVGNTSFEVAFKVVI